jgi:hypothetical protein
MTCFTKRPSTWYLKKYAHKLAQADPATPADAAPV